MRRFISICLVFLMLGCASTRRNNRQTSAAFQAGRRAALAGSSARVVRFLGDFKNSTIEWRENLGIIDALVAAEYGGASTPRQIIVRRGSEKIPIDPRLLVRGEDWLLEPGDVVEIVP